MVEAAGCLLASLKESNSMRSQPGSPIPGLPRAEDNLAHRGCLASFCGKNGWMEMRKGAAEKEAAETRKKWGPLEP